MTTIGADVWIGVNAIIRSGVTIGTGSVIGAGSVVLNDIPEYEIWAGNPARKIRDRFSEEIKRALLQMRWWEWDDHMIEEYAELFDDPQKLARVMQEKGMA